MPSFSTINGSYHHFFVSMIENGPAFTERSKHSLCRFLLISLLIIAFTILLITAYFTLILFDYHDHSWWDRYKLWWIYDSMVWSGIGFITLMLASVLITATTKTPIFHFLSLCHRKWVLLSMVTVLLVAALYASVSVWLPSTESVFGATNPICSFIKCDFWSLKVLFEHILFIGFLPLTLYTLWLTLCCLLSCGRHKGRSQHHIAAFNELSEPLRNDLEMGLLRPSAVDLMADSSDYRLDSSLHSNVLEAASSLNVQGVTYSLLFGVLFGVLWTFKFWCGRIKADVLKKSRNFEFLYYYVLVYQYMAI